MQQVQHNVFDTRFTNGYAYFYEGISERIRGRKTAEGRPSNREPMGEEGNYPRGNSAYQHPPVAHSTRNIQ
jgi:hypothetical protein